ncbi:bifunctional Gfo/Idh/MocA family oxidoreductase/class I SAM-dependent methyltransferase [Aquimarina aquimarini]|uniref:bifunctional Gfo/Idh/MocA family oxidoreductase/class I SAM-dependent methyltransferase n=1 Tax=Aquimarina aquimarini TaxID=1191734 RepID=UPI000D56146C|nr:bifunctional Gfo/Idh/MocA family oxidoreductase/class I SAM-dependent methyltransferase [Aquimarina aquimarini]
MKPKRLKTVVCGSTFGQFYLESLKKLENQFEIVGLLSQGSERSTKCAAAYEIPLFTSVDQLPEDVDLACVVLRSGVMGGNGTELSLQFLEKGIHVLQEHPVHYKDLAICLRAAQKNNVRFQTGDLYVHLPEVRRFINCSKAVLKEQKASYIEVAYASQVSYPLMHILSEALPNTRPWKIDHVTKTEGPFTVLTGSIGKTPIILRAHNEVNPDDPDNHLHLLHKITIGVEGGSLSLSDTHGPVVWHPRLHFPENVSSMNALSGSGAKYLLENSTQVLGEYSPANYKEILSKQWPYAIGQDLLSIKESIETNKGGQARSQNELLVSRQWQDLTNALGYPSLSSGINHQPLPVEILQKVARQTPATQELLQEIGEPKVYSEKDIYSCTEVSDTIIKNVTTEQIKDFVDTLDKAVLHSMLFSLQKQGVLTHKNEEYTLSDIVSVANISPKHKGLIAYWLDILAKRGYLDKLDTGFANGDEVITTDVFNQSWGFVKDAWDHKLGDPITMEYLVANAEQLPELMSDTQQAALLLFPEGRLDIANSLYRDTITAKYLNQSVSEAVHRIAKYKMSNTPSLRKIKILEIGAGTGATTVSVAPKLQETIIKDIEVEYLFTDLSSFFLNNARQLLKDYSWIDFQVLDIDQDFVSQQIPAEGFDIIIAAGVLNNAENTDRVITQMMSSLTEGGWLLITEPTREFLEILISQAFMMTTPEDERKEDKTTFFTPSQWSNAFNKAGAQEVVVLPEEENPLTPFEQKLFIVKK